MKKHALFLLCLSSAFMCGCATYHGFMFNPWERDVHIIHDQAVQPVETPYEPTQQSKDNVMNEEQFYNV